jgi:hypothetical protein|tara:strand:- start:17 stop:622 length:606 start_codon:yes stop_codon:yes gene_type:complete
MAYKQHFIEWFSGKQKPSYWSIGAYQDTVQVVMEDVIDGGLSMNTNHFGSPSSLDSGGIDFGNKRQYSATGSVSIIVMKRKSTATSTMAEGGLFNNFASAQFKHSSAIRDNSASTNKQLSTNDGTTTSTLDSTVAVDALFHAYKIENGQSNNKLTIDGVLEITKESNPPALIMQPFIAGTTVSGTTVAHDTVVRYMECYNT